MSSSIIEDSRATAEDGDLLDRALVEQLHQLVNAQSPAATTHRQKLATSHRASNLLDRIVDRQQILLQSLSPTNIDRSNEIENLTGKNTGGDLAEFYQRLAKLKEYHRKYPVSAQPQLSADRTVDFAALEQGDDEWLDKRFTGEEGLGRYLDLHEHHEAWNNLSPASTSGTAAGGGWKRLTYLQYLGAVTAFALSPALKSSPQYSKYLTNLLSYLSSFHEKVLPLKDLDEVLKLADDEFAKKWELGEVKGWPREEEGAAPAGGEGEAASENIWCAACQKTYSKQTVYNAHLTSKKHVKAAAKLTTTDGGDQSSSTNPTSAAEGPSLATLRRQKNRAIALKEALIVALVGDSTSSAPPPESDPQGQQKLPPPLGGILTETRNNTERRAALTDKERAAEIDELEAREAAEAAAAAAASHSKSKSGGAANEDDDDDEGRIYNPLRLPLGWDGKPIPFWLYKLHGLGVEYKCEICSDFVYQGRKNFEKHFQESRHAFGMRALGLPNTKHFHEITRIEDAIALAEKLKQEGRQEMNAADLTEELEDSEGNVYNRKTWDDLKRQGLL
ncbi:hypothetical protein T439DRAFT_311059 [Meredithblackwellia eburnea MCA 4105]